MKVDPSIRGVSSKRSIESIISWNQRFINSGGNIEEAKEFFNCISPPIIQIPLAQVRSPYLYSTYSFKYTLYLQVCLPGLHITQGIFVKLFNILEDECHKLDLTLAIYSCDEHALDTASSYTKSVNLVKQIQTLSEDVNKKEEKRTLITQFKTFVSVAVGQSSAIIDGLDRQSAKLKKDIKTAVRCLHALHCLCILY